MDIPKNPNPQVKNSNLAFWSFVLGLLGILLLIICVGPLFGVAAVICGHIAQGRIKRSGGALTGQGLAVAGLVAGYVSIVASVFVLAVVVPNFVKVWEIVKKNACINNLRMIDGAKQQWALENGKTGDAVPTEQDLAPYLKIGFSALHCPLNGTYSINRVADSPTCSIPGHDLDAVRRLASASSPSYTPPQRSLPGMVVQSPSNSINSAATATHFRDQHKCEMQLQMIALAKRSWAQRYRKRSTDVPTLDDLVPFLPGKQFPVCPAGGTYNPGAMNENPSCSIPEHQYSGPPPMSVNSQPWEH